MRHRNSKESLAMGVRHFTNNAQIVLGAYEIGEAYTDRQIATKLGKSDMNFVRPRINELLSANELIEIGSTKDTLTNRTVRVCMVWGPKEKK